MTLLVPPAILTLIFALLMWCATLFFPSFTLDLALHLLVSLLIMSLGMFLILLSSVSLFRLKTTLNPMKPELASALVKTGLYRHSRNPIYLGMLLILLGWGIFLSNILAILFVTGFVCYMNSFQIEPEENALARIFGAEFDTYKCSVRRWL